MNWLEKELTAHGNAAQREVLMRFFKTGKGQYGEGDQFLGVKVPVIRALAQEHGHRLVDVEMAELITSPYHEARLLGLLVLIKKYKAAKKAPDTRQALVDLYLANVEYINNWDLVDLTCYELLGNWLLDKDRALLHQKASPNLSLWENRIAIVSTLQFIRHGQFEDTIAISDLLIEHRHNLIHKAVGWMLREIGKRNQTVLEDYLKPRYHRMPRTMLRYAIERFPEPLRQRYLKGDIGVGEGSSRHATHFSPHTTGNAQ